MRYSRSFAILLALLSLLTGSLRAQTGDKLPPINVSEYKLKNGLTVLLHRDTSTPIVAVNVWYHVGSKNEAPGRTGFAHLFEHMMFQGSKNYVDGWRSVDELGGNVNGTTNEDRTYYYEAIPSNFLERVIWLEADRLASLDVSDANFKKEREVVKEERRLPRHSGIAGPCVGGLKAWLANGRRRPHGRLAANRSGPRNPGFEDLVSSGTHN